MARVFCPYPRHMYIRGGLLVVEGYQKCWKKANSKLCNDTDRPRVK